METRLLLDENVEADDVDDEDDDDIAFAVAAIVEWGNCLNLVAVAEDDSTK